MGIIIQNTGLPRTVLEAISAHSLSSGNNTPMFKSHPTISAVLKLSWPIIVTNAVMNIVELTDAFFVGRLGPDALAGVFMAEMLIFFLATFVFGLSIGAVALIARAYGQKDFDLINAVAVHSSIIGLGIALIIGLAGALYAPQILAPMGAQGVILDIGVGYLRIIFYGLFTMFFLFIGNSIFLGLGDTVTPMKINIGVALCNIVLDPLLIFGIGFFPPLGARGAALASVISRGAGGLLMLRALYRKPHPFSFHLKHFTFNFSLIREIFAIGIPGSLQLVLRSFAGMVLIKYASYFGVAATAVYGLGNRLQHFFLLPGFGFGAAEGTLVGRNLGAKNPEKAQRSSMVAGIFYFAFLCAAAILVFIYSEGIVKIFSLEPDVVRQGQVYFRLLAAASLFLPMGVVLSRAMQGAGDTVPPMVITGLTLYGVTIPAAYVLAFPCGMRELGIWIAASAGNALNGIVMWLWFLRGKWKHKEIAASYKRTKNGSGQD